MDIFQAITLGIVQALTEFLPVSSSGHLVLFQKFFAFETPPIFFDVLIHVGTLVAVLVYLRKELVEVLVGYRLKENQRLIGLVLFGTIPIVFVGLLLRNDVESIFNSLTIVGFSFLITAVILWSTYFVKKFDKNLTNLSWKDSLFIGLFQALAILPGVSRAGATIAAGLFRGINREASFRFSFFLAIPAIVGALVLELIKMGDSVKIDFVNGLVGFLIAVIFGFLALRILEKVLIKGKLPLFGFYCFILGIIVLVFLR